MWAVIVAALTAFGQWLLPRIAAVFGVIAVTGVVYTPLFKFIENKIVQSLNGMGAEPLQLLRFVGVFDCLSIIFAAVTLKIGIMTAKAAFTKKAASDV